MTRRLGILGGTFDPLHCGHLDVGIAADAALGLTELLVIPSNIPPHRGVPSASAFHRFAMVALGIAGRPHWRASDIELRTAAPSYTSTTLDRVRGDGYAATEVFFVLGADAFAEIETWRNYPAVVDQAHFVVVSRPGVSVHDLGARVPSLAPRMTTATDRSLASDRPLIFLIDAPTADVSATAIRGLVAAGRSIVGLVPAAVAQHIEQHRLYAHEWPASDARTGTAAGRLHGQN
jgi:nicotinate-nucleotide adenylyltransferase